MSHRRRIDALERRMPPEASSVRRGDGGGEVPAELRPVLRAALAAYYELLDARGWVNRGGVHWPVGPPLDWEVVKRREDAHARALHAVCAAVQEHDGALPRWLKELAVSADLFDPERRERALTRVRATVQRPSRCTAK